MKLVDTIYNRFQSNPKLAWTFVAIILSIVIHNWPWLLAFLPNETAAVFQNLAYIILNGLGPAAVAWWAKQHNTIGNS